MEKWGGGGGSSFFFCVCSCLLCHLLLLLLKQVIFNTLHLFSSPLLKQRQITEDNRALRNTGLLDIFFLDLYMEEIIM